MESSAYESTECSLDSSILSAPRLKIDLKLNMNAVFALDDKFGENEEIRPRLNSTRNKKELKRPTRIP